MSGAYVSRVLQEFYCGECEGYIRVKLNMAINNEVDVECPNCHHKHRRCIKDGEISERGRFTSDAIEEICPTIAAYSKEPITKKMRDAHKTKSYADRRDGVVVGEEEMRLRWAELDSRQRQQEVV